MKKVATLILLAFVCHSSTFAQADNAVASVRYKLTHISDTTQPENPLTENTILYLGKHMSNYTNYDRVMRTKNAGAAGAMSASVSFSSSGGNVSTTNVSNIMSQISASGNCYKDQDASKMSMTQFAGGKLFAIEEKTPAIDWNITQETKEMQGMQCQKATCFFKGRNYEAWFTTQLPYSNGPWKLGGLPGLIIEASDTKKEVVFSFVSYENVAADSAVAIEIPATALKTSTKEFKQYQEALKKDQAASNGGGAITSAGTMQMVRVGGQLSSGDGKPLKPRVMNNPIEKEEDTKK